MNKSHKMILNKFNCKTKIKRVCNLMKFTVRNKANGQSNNIVTCQHQKLTCEFVCKWVKNLTCDLTA